MRKKKALPLPIILFGGVFLLSIAAMILIPQLRSAQEVDPASIETQDDVPRVMVEEAYNAVVNGEAVLVDTRSETQFAVGHAAGAINIPVEQTESRLAELDPDTWVITYCT
jgi:predicted sulfurtransferase